MKIRSGFILRDVGGKTFVVAIGELSKKFNGMITLNETGKYIWEQLQNDTTEAEIVNNILSRYEDVDKVVVESDVSNFINKLKNDGILE